MLRQEHLLSGSLVLANLWDAFEPRGGLQPFEKDIPKIYVEREKTELPYYQWVRPIRDSLNSRPQLYPLQVPFVLAIQAILFYSPLLIWRSLNIKTGAPHSLYSPPLGVSERGWEVRSVGVVWECQFPKL